MQLTEKQKVTLRNIVVNDLSLTNYNVKYESAKAHFYTSDNPLKPELNEEDIKRLKQEGRDLVKIIKDELTTAKDLIIFKHNYAFELSDGIKVNDVSAYITRLLKQYNME